VLEVGVVLVLDVVVHVNFATDTGDAAVAHEDASRTTTLYVPTLRPLKVLDD
jgi:hypothetical protein